MQVCVLISSLCLACVQAQFTALAATLGGENAHFAFFYDESLSHLIYAGCDLIAVPSMFEPCGLTQVTYGSQILVAPSVLWPSGQQALLAHDVSRAHV